MPLFVIERHVPGAGKMTEEELRAGGFASLRALGELGPEIQWVHSYITEDKIYCLYLARDPEIIREHARRTGLPVDRVSAVRRLLDPVNLQ
jgi:Protein of unknown function (DUF4242)